MSVDFGAITISLDGIFLIPMAIQILICTYFLIRSIGRPLPTRPAVLVLLGGMTFHLAGYATVLAEDSAKETSSFPNARPLNIQSVQFQLVEELLGTFGYITTLASVLLMVHLSGTGTKNERWMKMVVRGGAFFLFVTLAVDMVNAAFDYQTNLWLLDQVLRALKDPFYALRNISIISIVQLIVSVALTVVLALGGFRNTVHRLRTAILFGLIPASLVQISLSAIHIGLFYSGPHFNILLDPAYIYVTSAVSRVAAVAVPACALYAGFGWTTSDPSYTMQSSTEDVGRKVSLDRKSSVEDMDMASSVEDMDKKH